MDNWISNFKKFLKENFGKDDRFAAAIMVIILVLGFVLGIFLGIGMVM